MNSDSILLVDDDPVAIKVLRLTLSGLGDLRCASNGIEALRLAREAAPRLMLLEAQMAGMSGLRVCEEVKADRDLADVPVIFVTGHADPHLESTVFDLGAVDFITKPLSPAPVRSRIKAHLEHKRANDTLCHLARIDLLTKLADQLGFNESLEREWRRARRSGDPLSLLLVDVDHFRSFNEHKGTGAGDECLRAIAERLVRACTRPADLLARLPGDTFGLMLPQTPRAGAEHVAHRVMDAIEALHLDHPSSPMANHVTASVGVGSYDSESVTWVKPSPYQRYALAPPPTSVADLLEAAAIAMRAAKRGGRAQAWFMDADDVNAPHAAREITLTR